MKPMKPSTPSLVKDFIGYKLRKAGYENSDGGRLLITEAPSTVHRYVRQMGDEFETAYFSTFDDMTGNINIHGTDLKNVLFNILDITFQSGIQWGRICGAFVFAAKLAIKARACERIDVVENVTEWSSSYLEQQRFSNWINQHGGWDGFVNFYKNPSRENSEHAYFNWAKACSFGLNMLSGVATVANSLMNTS